mmetsp:Transcript_15408/g.32823  ORF Transcript_15408/g.32823 Transcript_15408/m.32823 type:complete len:236 (-) Transcript_15408:274-981(-)
MRLRARGEVAVGLEAREALWVALERKTRQLRQRQLKKEPSEARLLVRSVVRAARVHPAVARRAWCLPEKLLEEAMVVAVGAQKLEQARGSAAANGEGGDQRAHRDRAGRHRCALVVRPDGTHEAGVAEAMHAHGDVLVCGIRAELVTDEIPVNRAVVDSNCVPNGTVPEAVANGAELHVPFHPELGELIEHWRKRVQVLCKRQACGDLADLVRLEGRDLGSHTRSPNLSDECPHL